MAYDLGPFGASGNTTLTAPNLRIPRTVAMSGFTVEFPTIIGGIIQTPPSGPGGVAVAAAVGYLWPRGDGTPSAS